MRTIVPLAVTFAAVLVATQRADATAPLRCTTTGANCCATSYGPGSGANERTCTQAVGTAFSPARRNILFVLADDLGYCHTGFMVTKGVCSGSGALCATNGQCPAGQACQFELTCRNRLPGFGQPQGGKDAGAFAFDRDGADGTAVPVKTPFLDDLAAHGAVFPRAHVAASTCTSSRQTFLTGRFQRHSAYLAQHGDTRLECIQSTTNEMATDPPQSCDPTAACTTGTCAPVRTIARLLTDLTDGSYRSYASGKLEFFNPDPGFTDVATHRKRPQVGKFRCSAECGEDNECGTNCQRCLDCREELGNDVIPQEARDSVAEVPEMLQSDATGIFGYPPTTTTLPPGSPPAGTIQTNPFFIWYGPNIPHRPGSPDKHFLDIYDQDPSGAYATLHENEKMHFGRVSWLDFGVRTIADYLQTSCVCSQGDVGGPYAWRSLYDTTVVIYAGGDQGFLMPKAKHNYTENGHRMALVVSTPEHRRTPQTLTPKAFPDEFAHTSDVLQTVLAYAGVATPVPYEYGRNLKPWVEGATGHIRPLQYGEKGAASVPNNGGPQYLINRPGLVGVCDAASAPTAQGHVRPCVTNEDCGAGGSCVLDGKRCVNRPDQACTSDAQCTVTGMCAGSPLRCADLSLTSPNVTFKDMHDKPCATAADCVPAGVCRPPMVKAEANAKGQLKFVWDVNLNPDQTKNENLLKADSQYLAPCIRRLVEKCLYKFRAFEPAAEGAALPTPPVCATDLTALEAAWCPEAP